MKYVFALILSAISAVASAQEMTCLDKLLPFNRHSGVHQLNREHCSSCSDVLNSTGAKLALKTLLNSRLFCGEAEVVFQMDPVCDLVSRDMPESNVCFVKSNLGHFFISKDYNRNFNFIFSREKIRP